MNERGPYFKDLEKRIAGGNHTLFEPERVGRTDDEFYITLPHSDLAEWIYERDEVYKAAESLSTWRLSRVKTLSYLVNLGNESVQYFDQFSHDRHEHTLLVARMSEKIMRRNHMSEGEINKSIFAGVAHDRATPGLGDAIKPVDVIYLHEEDFWWDGIEDKGWEHLKEIGGTKEEIDDIIHNKGLLGEVLDIADRISYVMKDMGSIAAVPNFEEETLPYWAEYDKILVQDTKVGNIYRDVRIDKTTNQIYFSDQERLRRFLEIRALLHRDLYMNPISQSRDLLITNLAKAIYSTDEGEVNKLTPGKLRRMGDEEVERFISSKYEGFNWDNELGVSEFFIHWRPEHTEIFESVEEAQKRKEEIEKDFNIAGIKDSKGFSPATHYKVMDDGGKILPFIEVDPECSERLQEISDSTKKVYLFYTSKELPRLKSLS